MGCGCKTKSNEKVVNSKTGELNWKGKLIKLPIAIIITLLLVVLSPFLLLVIWYLAMVSIFEHDAKIIQTLLFKYNNFKLNNEDDEENQNDFDPSEYELMDVDKVK
jgi:hypothetical protein